MPHNSTACAKCGQLLPAGSAQGQCPQCLLKAALEPLEAPTEAAPKEQDKTYLMKVQARDSMEGKHIGRYKLLQELGEGGFGIVYLAQQMEPVKRRVALKVIKPGMDSREIIARFEAERQALALMDHPNIAQVFDGGTSDSGRPYFVMELVKGVPITQYCDDARLGMRQRLELFLDVLAAVQHAHQKGVIHRDLKPSNILVSPHDGRPVVKVIDFGIAKALNIELTEKTLFTGHGRLIGTPEYMSPEQAEINALDVDTRSDVYSLGVVLYELMTGKTPLDPKRMRQAGYDEIQRMIRDEEPQRPSTRLSTQGESLPTVASRRGTEPAKLTRQLRGELDWIVMKALEKERDRRYGTASAFAEDIKHHLADEPVSASPPSRLYRLRKIVRRNRTAITTATMVVTALIAGTVVSLWQAGVARDARDASKEAEALASEENGKRKQQLREAARTDRLNAMEMFDRNRPRDAFALLARACEYDPESTLAAETAVLQLNVLGLARETHVLVGKGTFPVEPLNRNGWLKRVENEEWLGVDDATFSKDGRHVLTMQILAGHSGLAGKRANEPDLSQAVLWDSASGSLLEEVKLPLNDLKTSARWRPGTVKTQVGTLSFDWQREDALNEQGQLLSPDHQAEVAIDNGSIILRTREDNGSGHVLDGHDGEVRCARFSTDGLQLLTGGADQTVLLREAGSGTVDLMCVGHAGSITNARFNEDGTHLVSCSQDTTARIWETADTRLMAKTSDSGEDRLMSVAVTSEGTILGCTFDQNRFYWDLITGELLREAKGSLYHEMDIEDFRYAGDHFDLLCIDGRGKTLVLIDEETGKQQAVFTGHTDNILHARLSPNGHWVASAARDKTVRIWDARIGRSLFVSNPEFEIDHSPPCILFSPDSSHLLVISHGKNCLMEVPSGKVLFELQSDSGTKFLSAGFSPDARLLAAGDNDAKAKVWDVASGKMVAEFTDHPQTITSVVFSPDGSLLATACWRESVMQIWDTRTWQRQSQIHRPMDVMERVVFSPDSRFVVAESDRQNSLNIWVARTGEAIAHLPRQQADLGSVAFSPDGHQLITASRESGALIWEVPCFKNEVPPWFPDFLRMLVQRRVDATGQMRNLSPDDVIVLRENVLAGASNDPGRYGQIVRWFLAPADERPVRPGASKTRKEIADRLIVPDAGPVQLKQALRFAPSNALARHALANFATHETSSRHLRTWAKEHMPSPIPADLQERMRNLRKIEE